MSADLVRFGLLVLGHSGRDVGNYFTDISNSFRPTFTEYQTLSFLQKLWMFDKSESVHMKSDDQISKSGYLNKTWALSPVRRHSEDILMMEAVCRIEPQWTMAWYLQEIVVGW